MKTTSPGFIHDMANLDRLRAGIGNDQGESLKAAAQQFEAIFTQMLFKSMRQANEAFESDLMSSSNSKFFEQMHDEQMASELSSSGSLGLADLIVEQLGGEKEKAAMQGEGDQAKSALSAERASDEFEIREIFQAAPVASKQAAANISPDTDAATQNGQVLKALSGEAGVDFASIFSAPVAPVEKRQAEPVFDSPKDFVARLTPFAKKAAKALGTDPAVLIAQAALETGWGKKVIKNAAGSSHNLFNIKADPRWDGGKVATNTLEFHQGIPVQEKAAFRAYANYQDSFNDYVRFLNDNPRYGDALAQPEDPKQFIRNLHQAGYATDPKYADKIIGVMDSVKGYMDEKKPS